MPNRVIKESIKRSPQIDSLTWFEEVVFYRLIVTADDYGCTDGRPVLLKNELFPTKETITKKSIEEAIRKLASVGLVYQYESNGMPYLFFPTWEKHQRVRNKHRKCPKPPDDICSTANCCQMSADCQPESNPNPIQSESESESKPRGGAEKGAFELYAGGNAELLSALEDYGSMRQKIKKPMTERAKKQLCDRLDKLAGTAAGKVELLNEAILHCWQSVYVPDGWKEGARGNADNAGADPGKAAKGYRLRSALDDLDGY